MTRQGQLAAEYATLPTAQPCATCYLTADTLGSTRMVTDGNARVQSLADYLPFGEEIPAPLGARAAPLLRGQHAGAADGVTQQVYRQRTGSGDGAGLFRGQVTIKRSPGAVDKSGLGRFP